MGNDDALEAKRRSGVKFMQELKHSSSLKCLCLPSIQDASLVLQSEDIKQSVVQILSCGRECNLNFDFT